MPREPRRDLCHTRHGEMRSRQPAACRPCVASHAACRPTPWKGDTLSLHLDRDKQHVPRRGRLKRALGKLGATRVPRATTFAAPLRDSLSGTVEVRSRPPDGGEPHAYHESRCSLSHVGDGRSALARSQTVVRRPYWCCEPSRAPFHAADGGSQLAERGPCTASCSTRTNAVDAREAIAAPAQRGSARV